MVNTWTMFRCYRAFVVLGILFFLTGCTREKSFSTIEEMEKYARSVDSPFVQSATRNGVKITVRYLPTEIMLIRNYKKFQDLKQQLAKDTSKTQVLKDSLLLKEKKEIENTRGIYDQSLYFSMTIGYEDQKRDIEYDKMREGFDAYSQWMQKLVFSMKEYIYLDSPTAGEVPLALYDMQRTFGITKDRTFLLVFTRNFNEQDLLSKENKWLKMCIKEFGLATGSMEFEFELPFVGVSFLGF